jgi:transcriptional accessory protein Tex/SPT6
MLTQLSRWSAKKVTEKQKQATQLLHNSTNKDLHSLVEELFAQVKGFKQVVAGKNCDTIY